MNETAPVFNISRLRLESDGQGVRTLVCFKDCPLKCKWCPNEEQMKKVQPHWYTPESLLESLKLDDIYFRASYGGITFGGGEPALRSNFIADFARQCNREWSIYIETSLNVPLEDVQILSHVIDYWYIDVKDGNDKIYRKYTKKSNALVLSNLKYLVGMGLKDKITVRIPKIPGYNTPQDVQKTEELIRGLGIENIDFLYYSKSWPETVTTMGKPAEPVKSAWYRRIMRIMNNTIVKIYDALEDNGRH